MVRREPPRTEEGWYALHDLRTIDWTAWRDAPQRVRDRALEEASEFLRSAEAVADAEAGDSAAFTVLGHEADLMVVHLRPTLADLDALERGFETTEFAQFTEQSYSYVSVTEASGYTERAREYFEGEVDEDSGLAQYIQSRLHPRIPDAEHVSFYPMSKRRDPEYNWYDLPFEERAEHMASHGDVGRDYAGKVQQMITGSVGMDDWEWGVTLWADDLTDVKDLLSEMRFDPSTSKYAEFGPFFVGRRFPPVDLPALLAGERIPAAGEATDDGTESEGAAETSTGRDGLAENGYAQSGARSDAPSADGTSGGHADETDRDGPPVHVETDGESDGRDPGEATAATRTESATGGPPAAVEQGTADEDVERRLARFGVRGDEYDDGDYGLVFYSGASAEDLVDEVEGLRENFEHYDTHVLTSVRADQGQAAVVSVWATERAASTAAGFLGDLPEITHSARGPLGDGVGSESDAGEAASDGASDGEEDGAADVRSELAELDIYGGQPHGEDVFALVLYSDADREELFDEVDDLRDGFDRYDTHVKTAVYETTGGGENGDEADGGESGDDGDGVTGVPAAVVSIWETESAADEASNFLSDLPEVVGRPADREGFGTMGMFYTVEPDHREDFIETFGRIGGELAEMDGHRESALLVNREDENDMFIASRWDAREDAMAFFRSEEFRETVEWGREILADRPRHVFLA